MLAELVLDDRNLLAVLRREDVVQERRLARAEEAGEDGDGDFVLGHFAVRFDAVVDSEECFDLARRVRRG